ncbi:MAG TPA: dihydropteroate synthase [Anaeromyxobacteraceae bacterium]|nr:dihydropteroate synthase [Anaeromyxobacteraceae bacterium]
MQIGGRVFEGRGPFLMGVVNVTPDSFSDGGRFLARDAALAEAERLGAEGADLVDIGGESTRPGAPEVPPQEEIGRVVPVIAALRARGFPLPISVDTRKAEVARAALAAGADLVNDVSALGDPDMAGAVRDAGVPVVLMHMRGTPADMASRAVYGDVVAEVEAELRQAMARAAAAGLPASRVVLDPGIGFAKTAEGSLRLLGGLSGMRRRLGRPLLVGPSRKSFIGKVTGAEVGDRLPGTLAAVAACVLAGVEFVRVHDVAAARQAARVAAAIRDATGSAAEG